MILLTYSGLKYLNYFFVYFNLNVDSQLIN